MAFASTFTAKWVPLRLFLLLGLAANAAFSGDIVRFLPGFDGELPFHLETGYINVGDSELFYYFFESQGDPKTDPLFLWLSGGPGCSPIHSIFYENGPLELDINHYEGGIPRLLYYPYAWTKTASFLFVDSPVGTGFSYSNTLEGWPSSDSLSSEQVYQFLRKWLIEHPQYLDLRLFIGGDSYSGIIVPLVTQKIVIANDADVKPHLNLTGYLIGSPTTDEYINSNSKVVTAHKMALISDKLYEELKLTCNENYVYVDASNTACLSALAKYEKCIEEIWSNNFLEPNCYLGSSKGYQPLSLRRSLQENVLSPPKLSSELWCRAFNYQLAYNWANDPGVQQALHVRAGKVQYWSRCNQTLSNSYTKDVQSVIDVHRWLSRRQLEVMVECGDHDLVVPYVATETWLKILNLTIYYRWRPWYVDGQVAGYTRKYYQEANGYRLTFATVKGGGHVAPEYSRKECYEMFLRWIRYYPL